MAKIAVIGDNCVDYYSNLSTYYLTGNAVDTAVNLAKLGILTSIVTTVANDDYGKEMYETFQSFGLDTTHVSHEEGDTAITYMDLNGKDRVHGDYVEGVMETITFSPEAIEFVAKHDYVHSAFWGKAENVLKEVSEKNPLITISYDFADRLHHEKVKELKGIVDIGFFSYKQECDFIKNFLADRVAEGMKIAVATLGENGSLAYDGVTYYRYGIFPANVENTIGAGDSYIAGFLAEYARSRDIVKSLEEGARVAAEVISVFGPWVTSEINKV